MSPKRVLFVVAVVCGFLGPLAAAQGLIGTLDGTVKDDAGGALEGALVRVSSPALIGGPQTATTNVQGQWRFPTLPPGLYVLEIEKPKYATSREADIYIGAGATIERHRILKVSLNETVVVEVSGSHIDARGHGVRTRFGPEDLNALPVRRVSCTTGSRPRRGSRHLTVRRQLPRVRPRFGCGPEPVSHRRDERHGSDQRRRARRPGHRLHSGSADPIRRGVRRVRQRPGRRGQLITRSGSNLFLYDASYYAQTAGLTSQPVRLKYDPVTERESGFERARYRRLHDHPRRSGGARSALVLRRIPAPARLRQPARHRPELPEDVRAGQVPREAHLATGSEHSGWCRAFTTSSGSTLRSRRPRSRSRRPSS